MQTLTIISLAAMIIGFFTQAMIASVNVNTKANGLFIGTWIQPVWVILCIFSANWGGAVLSFTGMLSYHAQRKQLDKTTLSLDEQKATLERQLKAINNSIKERDNSELSDSDLDYVVGNGNIDSYKEYMV